MILKGKYWYEVRCILILYLLRWREVGKYFDYCLKCNKVDSCLMIKFFGLKEFKKR